MLRRDDAGIGENENTGGSGGKREAGVKSSVVERESMDARPILGVAGDRDFGVVKLDQMHLSQVEYVSIGINCSHAWNIRACFQRRAKRRTPEGYYWPTTVVNFDSCG